MSAKITVTKTDLDRIERKIDMIIDYFNIEKQPRRSKKEIEAIADEIAADILRKEKIKRK